MNRKEEINSFQGSVSSEQFVYSVSRITPLYKLYNFTNFQLLPSALKNDQHGMNEDFHVHL